MKQLNAFFEATVEVPRIRIGKRGVLLVFDSLISPNLLSGSEVVRFMRGTFFQSKPKV
ncbi:hypothetical protein KAU55_00785 [Candidatus Bathyarchaeota archaeon]|nr:hypothetical protein [Candidatus Bathyarchaeota archaeon]